MKNRLISLLALIFILEGCVEGRSLLEDGHGGKIDMSKSMRLSPSRVGTSSEARIITYADDGITTRSLIEYNTRIESDTTVQKKGFEKFVDGFWKAIYALVGYVVGGSG